MPTSFDRAREKLGLYLSRQGLKHTRQRDTILKTFVSSPGHVTSEDLHRRVQEETPSIGAATVYRTLKLFEAAGVASANQFREGTTVYEHRVGHHDHLICLGCDKVIEFEDDVIERRQEHVASENQFQLTRHRHDLFGYCADCR